MNDLGTGQSTNLHPALQQFSFQLDNMPFFFASPQGVRLTQGVFAHIRETGNLAERVETALLEAVMAGIRNPVVVGALPFLPDQPANLLIPRTHVEFSGHSMARHPLQKTVQHTHFNLRPYPQPQVYKDAVSTALQHIERGELSKVVLSRSLEIECEQPLDMPQVLSNLLQANSRGFTFASPCPNHKGQRRFLMGASPELLVSRHGSRVYANPLAGSVARSQNAEEDQRRAEALLQSPKDLHEHKLVIDMIAEALAPLCKNLLIPKKPSLVQTPTLWHLSTEIHAQLKDPGTTSLQLAQAMHPTPAVCGYPTESARKLIDELEPFDRGLFTGTVGWCDANGDGEWAVTIRCAEVENHRLRLFAGAGVVKGSDPQKELNETSTKLQTMLNALGLIDEPEKTLLHRMKQVVEQLP